MNVRPSEASSREQMRIAQEEGTLLPGQRRKQPAASQDCSLTEDVLATGHPDAEKVAPTDGDGPADPAARGRDAPVDVR